MRAPLYEALKEHQQKKRGSFHIPGHKQGSAFDPEAKSDFAPLLSLDVTELEGLDDLHHPFDVIQEAQSLAAKAFGAEQTLFLVGGTTVGNLATILAVGQPDDAIIVQRSCHQSVFHGCLLAGVHPIYLPVHLHSESGLEQPIQPEELHKTLTMHPHAKAVVVTSPSYFGQVQPVAKLAQICHKHGVPLIVDEAHGAHFGFHPAYPKSAMQLGADVSIQSTHKMGTSMTMSSMLHVKSKWIDAERIAHCLRVVESSSPSYPLLASLDLARRYWMLHGYKRLGEIEAVLKKWRRSVTSLQHWMEVVGPAEQDPLKFTLRAKVPLIGYQIARMIEERGFYPELSDHDKVLFCFSVGTQEQELHQLLDCLTELDQQIPHMNVEKKGDFPLLPQTISPSVSLEKVKKGTSEMIPLRQAAGRVSMEMIVPYPPGIPVLHIGERWTESIIDYVERTLDLGGKVRGIYSSSFRKVNVLQ